MKEKTQRRSSGLTAILGALGFLAIASRMQGKSRVSGRASGGGGGWMGAGNPIFIPQRKKFKGGDKPMARRNTYKKFKKYA